MTSPGADTIAAIATPPGVGGIGVVRLSGERALEIALALARLRGLRRPRPRYAHLVQLWAHPDAERPVDEGLLLHMPAPHSYTGEDVVELSCHGGPVVLRLVLNGLLAAGARAAHPGEFTQRAFLNGKLDLAQAEAVADLVAAPTPAALRTAAEQLAGRLSEGVRAIRRQCLDLLAQLEAEIDFADEDVPPMPPATVTDRIAQVADCVATLLAGADRGILQRYGVRVALVGTPNVGKSSLMNALLTTDRAIVTDIPGTTRDVLEERFDLDGVPVVLSDTAGFRDTGDTVERLGVERASRALATANVAVLVLDGSRPVSAQDEAAAARVRAVAKPVVVALNKADLPAAIGDAEALALVPSGSLCRTVAIRGEVEELRAALAHTIGLHGGGEDAITVASVRHQEALLQAAHAIGASQRAVADNLPVDFVTIGLHGAVRALGQITGESATEDLLATIFAKFCIGK
ncbi:MAG: tRNA uridine-5-carboxymethylaminomethyl(34) synthesis GTPase MnmE [Actinobacteria bacterium]|nr:tRNA uridine-5-carboxymethylaminomethyl(34) synthesis GTPase MnmE [Actinomycetota bacterium]